MGLAEVSEGATHRRTEAPKHSKDSGGCAESNEILFKLTFWVDVSVYGSAQVSVRDWVAKRLVTVQRIIVQRSESTLKTREDVLNLMRYFFKLAFWVDVNVDMAAQGRKFSKASVEVKTFS